MIVGKQRKTLNEKALLADKKQYNRQGKTLERMNGWLVSIYHLIDIVSHYRTSFPTVHYIIYNGVALQLIFSRFDRPVINRLVLWVIEQRSLIDPASIHEPIFKRSLFRSSIDLWRGISRSNGYDSLGCPGWIVLKV